MTTHPAPHATTTGQHAAHYLSDLLTALQQSPASFRALYSVVHGPASAAGVTTGGSIVVALVIAFVIWYVMHSAKKLKTS